MMKWVIRIACCLTGGYFVYLTWASYMEESQAIPFGYEELTTQIDGKFVSGHLLGDTVLLGNTVPDQELTNSHIAVYVIKEEFCSGILNDVSEYSNILSVYAQRYNVPLRQRILFVGTNHLLIDRWRKVLDVSVPIVSVSKAQLPYSFGKYRQYNFLQQLVFIDNSKLSVSYRIMLSPWSLGTKRKLELCDKALRSLTG